MQGDTTQPRDQRQGEGKRRAGKRVRFSGRPWPLLLAPAGGVIAAFLVIVFTRPEAGDPTRITPPAVENASRPAPAHSKDRFAESAAMSSSREVSKTKEPETGQVDKLRREQKLLGMMTEVIGKFERDYPLVHPVRGYSKRTAEAWLKRWYDVIRRNRAFFDANARALNTVRNRNYDASGVLAILELAKSQEPIGTGTLGEVATRALDNPKSLDKLKRQLQDVVTRDLGDPALAAQVASASDRNTLAQLASHVTSVLRTSNFDNLSQVTNDAEWQDLFDEEVWSKAIGWIESEYRQSLPKNAQKLSEEMRIFYQAKDREQLLREAASAMAEDEQAETKLRNHLSALGQAIP
jgi:hypothetical protein